MKMTVKLGFIALATAVFVAVGCKKDNGNDPNSPNPNPTPTNPSTNTLCDGNSTNSYFPLVQQNYWEWRQGNKVQKWTVNGTFENNSKTYTKLKMVWDSGLSETEGYFRVENGNIYRLTDSGEFLYVPATPTLNQEWNYPVGFNGKRKIMGLNESVTTGSCAYQGLLKIGEYDGNSLINTYYYKKGLGIVRITTFGNMDLRVVTLK